MLPLPYLSEELDSGRVTSQKSGVNQDESSLVFNTVYTSLMVPFGKSVTQFSQVNMRQL